MCDRLHHRRAVAIAAINKQLSSEVGFRGLAKKLMILVFLSLGHIADTYVFRRYACGYVSGYAFLHSE